MTVFSGTDRFEIRRCLGSGSFGVVYEAFDRERNTRVALKLPHLGSAQGLYLFKQEFRSLADITHVNLAALFELLADGDRWFFTMELVDGVHLLDFLRLSPAPGGPGSADTHPTGEWPPSDEPLPQWRADGTEGGLGVQRVAAGAQEPLVLPSPPPDYARVRGAMRQLSEGLIALHTGGMLHRDLKPSNVLVTRGGRVVILDFGLATGLEAPDHAESLGGLAGTPAYMSPEQISGHQTTAASDWYSVGVLLYQALTGRLPFTGGGRAMLAQKLQQDPLEPSLLVPGTPSDLEELCMALLRRDPATRPRGLEILERFQDVPLAHPSPDLEARSRLASPVGREYEMDVLLEGFRLSRGGRTVAALLHGESGTGKSYLARRFLREVARLDDRAVVLQGRCYEQESVPFKALDSLVDALSQYLKRLPVQELDALLPRNIQALARLFPVLNQVPHIAESRTGTEIPDAQELRRRAFGALREVFRRMSLLHPVVLAIDDLQWGDLDSAALLTEILRPPDSPQLMLLLCYQAEDVRSSPVLQELLPRLVESVTILQDVELRALPRAKAQNLARMLLGPDTPETQEQAAWIAAESGGSPFFVQELAQHIRRAAGEETGRRLDDYIRIRVEALPEDSRNILQTLAVAGYPLDWEIVRQAARVEAGSIAALTSLRAGRLIRTRASARRRILETYHDRIRVAVVQATGETRVRELNLALATILEERSSTDAQALARHFEAAGLSRKASHYAIQAAAQAEASLAFDQAAALYQKALDLRTSVDPENASLWRRLGDALTNAGRSADAAGAYLEAAGGAFGSEFNRLQRRAAEEYLRSGNIEAGLAILGRLLALAGARLPATRAKAMASILWNRSRLALRGLGFKERAADLISPAQLERVDTFWAVAMGLGPVEVLRAADFQTRQLLLTLEAGEPFRVVRALAHESILIAAAGNRSLEQVHDLQVRIWDLAERMDHPNPQARARMAAGVVATLQGRWKASAEWLDKAEEILKQHCTGMDYELHLAQHHGLMAYLVLGDLPLIRQRLPVLLQEAREKGDLIAATNLRVSLSYVLSLARDDPGGARQDLQAAIATWSREEFHLQHYYHLVSRVNVDLYSGAFPAAAEAMREAEQGLKQSLLLKLQPILITILELRARTSLALAARIPNPESSRQLVRSARKDIRALRAERTSYGGALALKLEAMLAVAEGRTREAQVLLLRAERTFEACDMLLHVMVVRHCRGRLLGDQGRELVVSAETWMKGKGIQNPLRFSAMHVPSPL